MEGNETQIGQTPKWLSGAASGSMRFSRHVFNLFQDQVRSAVNQMPPKSTPEEQTLVLNMFLNAFFGTIVQILLAYTPDGLTSEVEDAAVMGLRKRFQAFRAEKLRQAGIPLDDKPKAEVSEQIPQQNIVAADVPQAPSTGTVV